MLVGWCQMPDKSTTNYSTENHYDGCCSCPAIICGQHLIKPCRVIMAQQVSSKYGKPLFILRVIGIPPGDTIFVGDSEIVDLMKYWRVSGQLQVRSASGKSDSKPGNENDPW